MTPVKNAPCVIALVDLSDGYEFDIGRVAQNIMLAADAIGVASCPVTLHKKAVSARVLGLPAGVSSRYAIAIGYPTGEPPAKTEVRCRRPKSDGRSRELRNLLRPTAKQILHLAE